MNEQQAHKLEQKILAKVPNRKMVLGLSGGPDSVFLLHILRDKKIIAAHLNHQIRQDSDSDQEFVEKLCNKLQIPLETLKVNIMEKSHEIRRGWEETGRIYRYEFFKKIAKKHRATTIVTAHHADDNLETILMNFTRGGGLKALTGMQTEDKIDNKKLLRPLLSVSKEQILEYLDYYGIKYRQDMSNFDTKYTRNNLRHEVIPKLTEINPNIASTVARNHQNLAEINDFLEESALNWIRKHSLTDLPANEFTDLHPALQKSILITLHKLHIGNTQNLESIHVHEAIELIHNNVGNKKKKMGKIEIQLKKGRIVLKK